MDRLKQVPGVMIYAFDHVYAYRDAYIYAYRHAYIPGVRRT
jgi:hypothetical protein